MLLVVKPAQLRDSTEELNEAGLDVVGKARTHAPQIVEDIISDFHPLRAGEVVPVGRDKPSKAARRQQQSVSILGIVQDKLALRDTLRGVLKAQELTLCMAARCFIGRVVESLTEGFHLE